MADTFRAGQVECCDLVGSEVDAVLTVFAVWPDRNALSAEGARHVPQPAFEADVVLGHRDGAHDLVLVIFDLREAVRGWGGGGGVVRVGGVAVVSPVDWFGALV